MHEKSQTQIETIAVLLFFFILVMLGFGFYTNISSIAVSKEREKLLDFESVKTSQIIASLPEIQCNNKANCIDILKFKSALSLVNDRYSSYYFNSFGFSVITLNEIYPEDKAIGTLYNKSLESYTYKDTISIPVSIFYPIYERYGFGIISIEKFSK